MHPDPYFCRGFRRGFVAALALFLAGCASRARTETFTFATRGSVTIENRSTPERPLFAVNGIEVDAVSDTRLTDSPDEEGLVTFTTVKGSHGFVKAGSRVAVIDRIER